MQRGKQAERQRCGEVGREAKKQTERADGPRKKQAGREAARQKGRATGRET